MKVAFFGQKGGVGKSTLACALAAEIARRKKGVLLVDADPPQHSSAMWCHAADLANLSWRKARDPLNDFGDLAEDTIIDCPCRLYDEDEQPTHAAKLTRAALVAADIGIIPLPPCGFDVATLQMGLDLAEEASHARQLEGREPLIVRVLGNSWSACELARDVQQHHKTAVWLDSRIRYLQAFKVANSTGRPLHSREKWKPAAEEVRALARELRGLHP